jgi:outer membrane protein TolC
VQVGGDYSSTAGQGVLLPFENASGALGVSIRQPLLKNLWIDSTRLNIQLSRKQIKASELELRQEIMSVATQVEVAYYDLFQARQNVNVQELAVALAQRHVTDSEKRVAAGRQARFEKNQAEAQVSSSKASLLAAQGAAASREFRLKGLLSDNFGDWEDVHIALSTSLLAPERAFNVGETVTRGLALRPDFLRAKVQLEREGLTLKYARNQLYPQVDLVASYGRRGTGLGFGDAWTEIKGGEKWGYTVGGVLTIPLGNRSARESYGVRKAAQEQSLLRFKKLEQDIIIQIRDSVQQAQIAFARVDATKQARTAAEAALQAEQKRFENGQSTSFVLLQVQNALTQARVAELGALAGYNVALAQLALQEGTTLERHNVNLKID